MLDTLMMRPRPRRAHRRHERAGHRHQAEHVGVVLAAQLGVGDLGQRAEQAEAGVVDQHVEAVAAGEAIDLGDRGGDRLGRGDVEGGRQDRRGLGAQRLELGDPAAGGDHPVAGAARWSAVVRPMPAVAPVMRTTWPVAVVGAGSWDAGRAVEAAPSMAPLAGPAEGRRRRGSGWARGSWDSPGRVERRGRAGSG
jgi:hypothetical protein